jgi:hypothetical protein
MRWAIPADDDTSSGKRLRDRFVLGNIRIVRFGSSNNRGIPMGIRTHSNLGSRICSVGGAQAVVGEDMGLWIHGTIS